MRRRGESRARAAQRRERAEERFYERLTLMRAVRVIVVSALVLTLGGALLERLVEPQTFGSYGEACWWAISTVTSTGFGDLVPQTAAGRAVASVVMFASLAWIPAVTTIVLTLHIWRRMEKHPLSEAQRAEALWREELLERLDRLEQRLAERDPDAPAARRLAS